jgi:hypothetical protein
VVFVAVLSVGFIIFAQLKHFISLMIEHYHEKISFVAFITTACVGFTGAGRNSESGAICLGD